ncbi:hypothetical protein TEU_03395 [Thermococcus eurythermalis]|uniref:Uncharacterized protein n=1 Tax=Thermococcus eurythermalis TaxID=1505907 RepID=A0A097QSM6_9EURY|nr:hypothetical protein [Thermococcus eurythermalis]AIU69466.1 hypothetical protein TEU_03395 [Thermococcus eurythermalis]
MIKEVKSISEMINDLLRTEAVIRDALFEELEALENLIEQGKQDNRISDDFAQELIEQIKKIEKFVVMNV